MSGSAGGGGGAGAVVRQGHLRKLKTMKKKFFVLRAGLGDGSATLEYYESEKKWRAGAAPRRVLPLASCYSVTRRLDLKQKHVIALFLSDEQFCVVAENEQDLHNWHADMLKLHHPDDAAEELLHPIQHVWQVNVQKKGLGAVKNIHGLYNLCLTDKTLSLVKIKSHNNVISGLDIPERIEYALKNIRRCGDSECFFYMEVGRQSTTGAGELWMHSEDTNIAQSMHSTILHAMRNCSKESENERDHIVIPKSESGLPPRRHTHSDTRGRAGLTSAEYHLTNTVTETRERGASHQRTVSLGAAVPTSSPLRVVHERTRSAPLTGEEVDTALGRAGQALDSERKPAPAARRASTGCRLSKLSPAHNKNAATLRNRCDSMPSRACSSFESERPPPRHNDLEPTVWGLETSRDEADSVAEWYRTPRIPEEPDVCDISKDMINMSIRGGGSYQHSRTSSLGVDDSDVDGYLAMAPHETPDGYLPMAPLEPLGGLISASSGSVCSGTPSTDPRFSEYQLEPATMHICETRPPRAYSVGSRPAPRAEARHRAYSVGARARPVAPRARASHDDLMLLDFTPTTKQSTPTSTPTPASVARTPPASFARTTDEYVDMSPRNAGYVEMKPGDMCATPVAATPVNATPAATPVADGYVEMTYGKSRPIAIAAARPPPPPTAASPDDRFRRMVEPRPSHGSQIFEFSSSLESPQSPAAPAPAPAPGPAPEEPCKQLATVREAAEDGRDRASGRESRGVAIPPAGRPDRPDRPDRLVSCSPHYVTLKPGETETTRLDDGDKGACGAEAPVVVAAGCGGAARFSLPPAGAAAGAGAGAGPGGAPPSPAFSCAPLNYAALDLQPTHNHQASAAHTYSKIDFVRSEKLHAGDAT